MGNFALFVSNQFLPVVNVNNMRDKHSRKAKAAITKNIKLSNDWDQKPDNICGKCGYHIQSCVCSVQKPQVLQTITQETSIDFYN